MTWGFKLCMNSATGRTVKLGPIEVSVDALLSLGRAFFGRDLHRGFGGFVVKVEGRTLFHCGDSAFFFRVPRNRLEHHQIETALLPIGAYDAPTGREVHMNPEEAVRAFAELGADRLIPMHYGTFHGRL